MARALVFAPLYPPYSGGAPTHFSQLAKNISDKHELHILTAAHSDAPYVEMDGNGHRIYRVIPWHDEFPFPIRFALESIVGFIAAVFISLIYRIEVAHIHSTSFSTPAVAVSMSILSIPFFYDCRDEGFHSFIFNIGSPAGFFSASTGVDECLYNSGILPADIIRVPVSNPSYVSNYAELSSANGGLSVVFVGALRELKGVKLLLDAFGDLAELRNNISLTIIGDGPLRETCRQSGFGAQVTVMGNLGHREAISRIAAADVLVLPSRRESFGRVVLEARSVGTPVVATRVGEVPSLIDDGETGILIERESDAIANALRQLNDNPEYVRRLSSNALGETWDAEYPSAAVGEAYASVTPK